MKFARADAKICVLSDGCALVAGGVGSAHAQDYPQAEFWDAATADWTATEPPGVARQFQALAALPDGRAIVSGGLALLYRTQQVDPAAGLAQAVGRTDATSEIYTRETNGWHEGPKLLQPRENHSMYPLPDGRVLVVGGSRAVPPGTPRPVLPVEFLDLRAGRSTAGAAPPQPFGTDDAVLLRDGRILARSLEYAQLFDPEKNAWSATGPVAVPRTSGGAYSMTLLTDGRVLVVGGVVGPRTPVVMGATATEFFDPSTNTWNAGPDLLVGRTGHVAAPLPDGGALVVGGVRNNTARPNCEVLDPTTWTWVPGGDSPYPRGRTRHAGAALPDGRVIMVGDASPTTQQDRAGNIIYSGVHAEIWTRAAPT